MLPEILLLSFATALARVLVESCDSDADCTEHHTCHNNICKKCLECNLLFREGNSCVVDLNNCGQCLNGYEEISVTDFSVALKPCKPITNKGKVKKCTDSSCPQNSYCNEELCIKCFNCSLFNRLHPVEKCARGLSECSSCMNGYSEVVVTVNTKIKLCKINSIAVHQDSFSEVSLTSIGSAFLLISLFLILIIGVIAKQQKVRLVKKTTSHDQISPSAPPLYTMDFPQHIKTHKADEQSVLSAIKICKESTQQARVFKQPDASYYYLEENENILELTRNIKGIFHNPKVPTASATSGGMIYSEELCERVEHRVDVSVVDFSTQHPNEIGVGSHESVDLIVGNESQTVEIPVNIETDSVIVQSSHQRGI